MEQHESNGRCSYEVSLSVDDFFEGEKGEPGRDADSARTGMMLSSQLKFIQGPPGQKGDMGLPGRDGIGEIGPPGQDVRCSIVLHSPANVLSRLGSRWRKGKRVRMESSL